MGRGGRIPQGPQQREGPQRRGDFASRGRPRSGRGKSLRPQLRQEAAGDTGPLQQFTANKEAVGRTAESAMTSTRPTISRSMYGTLARDKCRPKRRMPGVRFRWSNRTRSGRTAVSRDEAFTFRRRPESSNRLQQAVTCSSALGRTSSLDSRAVTPPNRAHFRELKKTRGEAPSPPRAGPARQTRGFPHLPRQSGRAHARRPRPALA